MDSDSFYPAFVTAARILGLGEVIVKKISAFGIELKEEEPKPPFPYEKNLNRIYWFNKAQGKIKELIVGLSFGNFHFMELIASGNWGNSLISIQSTDVEPEGEQASVGLGVVDRITKGVKFRTLLDSEQRSHYLQLQGAVPQKRTTIAGWAGTIGTIPRIGSFGVNHLETGRYEVVYGEVLPNPTVTFSCISGGGIGGNLIAITANGFIIDLYGLALTRIDCSFSFIVIG